MLKKIIRRIIVRMYPEIASGLHVPQFAAVVNVPDPPAAGEVCDEFRPYYAVDVRLLLPNGELDPDMPLMRDVPVAMTGAAPDRGFAALPQPGTIVEIAFAYGMQTKPFIRSVLPYKLKLPKIDETSQRWQQTAAVYQEVDASGNWLRATPVTITDRAGGDMTRISGANISEQAAANISRTSGAVMTDRATAEISTIAPKIWTGSAAENMWQIVSDFMATTAAALATLSAHTHQGPAPDQKDELNNSKQEMSAEKARLDVIKK